MSTSKAVEILREIKSYEEALNYVCLYENLKLKEERERRAKFLVQLSNYLKDLNLYLSQL